MDKLTKAIYIEIPWYKLFVDDIIFSDEKRERVNAQSKAWRQKLEYQSFILSMSKIKYI